MTDAFTRLSQQFDGQSKAFTEKTVPLVIPKPPKKKATKPPPAPPVALPKEGSSNNKLEDSKQSNYNGDVSKQASKASQQGSVAKRSSENAKDPSNKTPSHQSSALTASAKESSQKNSARPSSASQNLSTNMKSILTMSEDNKNEGNQENKSNYRPQSQSRLWSAHTLRTTSQRVRKDEEKKQTDEQKQKWHYQGALKEEKSHEYFKTTRVSTCSYIQKVGDVMMALPFYKAPDREKEPKLQKQSLKAEDYQVRPMTCTSSSKKPLEPYNPNAARNILKQKDVKMAHRNISTFQLSDGSDTRNMYKSLNKNIYGNFPKEVVTSNQAIASDINKRKHQSNLK